MSHTTEIYNWDFETGDLSGWSAEGNAFSYQPVYGDVISTARAHPIILGGDYWDTLYPIGHHGNYWIGTAENPLGDTVTGTLTSQVFPLNNYFITFLIGGTKDERTTRVELQVRYEDYQHAFKHILKQELPTKLLDPILLVHDGDFVVLRQATGHNSEILRREHWDIADLVHAGNAIKIALLARIKITDASKSGHINIDDFRFLDRKLPDILPTVWGFADLHCYPMAHLAFGGKLMRGKPTDPLAKLQYSNGTGQRGDLFSRRVLHATEAEQHLGTTFYEHPSCG